MKVRCVGFLFNGNNSCPEMCKLKHGGKTYQVRSTWSDKMRYHATKLPLPYRIVSIKMLGSGRPETPVFHHFIKL